MTILQAILKTIKFIYVAILSSIKQLNPNTHACSNNKKKVKKIIYKRSFKASERLISCYSIIAQKGIPSPLGDIFFQKQLICDKSVDSGFVLG